MTFQEICNEVTARGFDMIAANRIEDFVQRSYQTLCSRYQWPFLEENKEGKAPLEIKDLRSVLSVTDSTQERPLYGATRQWLLERFPDLSEEGDPIWWFLDGQTLRAFPLSEDTIVVRYMRKAPVLTAEEEPLVPFEWQDLIVDMAVIECLKDNDQYEVAQELKAMNQETLNEMIADQLQRDWQRPQEIVRTGRYSDYL